MSYCLRVTIGISSSQVQENSLRNTMLGKIDLHDIYMFPSWRRLTFWGIFYSIWVCWKNHPVYVHRALLSFFNWFHRRLRHSRSEMSRTAEKSKGSRVTKCPWICARCDFFITIICLSNCPTIPISIFKILVEFSTVDKPETHRISPNCMFGIMFLLGMIEFLILGILGWFFTWKGDVAFRKASHCRL